MSLTDPKRIVIVGAGVGGLTFACLLSDALQNETVKIRLLEQRSAPHTTRGPEKNHSITLRRDSGALDILTRLGLGQLVESRRTLSREFFFADAWPTGYRILVAHDAGRQGIRIMRGALIDTLEDAAAARGITVHWGTHVVGASVKSDTKVSRLTLADGTQFEADLVVVADGAGSAVRKALLPHDRLQYAGAVSVGGQCDVEELAPLFRNRHGILLSSDGNVAMFVAHETERLVSWGLACTRDEPLQRDLNNRRDAGELVQRLAKHFPPDARSLIETTRPNAMSAVSFFDKIPTTFLHGCVAFIGDASHAATPFSANGAGMAIVDADRLVAELSRNFNLASPSSRAAALARFDEEMVPRVTRVIRRGRISMALVLGWFSSTPLRRGVRTVALRVADAVLKYGRVAVCGALLGVIWMRRREVFGFSCGE